VAHEARPAAGDAYGISSLAQVLAGEPSGDDVDVGQLMNIRDVANDLDPWEASLENGLSRGVDLAQQAREMPSSVHAELKATNAGEEAGYAKARAG
jgi:hypothetical protein